MRYGLEDEHVLFFVLKNVLAQLDQVVHYALGLGEGLLPLLAARLGPVLLNPLLAFLLLILHL
jgi:hypothetical protein